MGVAALVFTAYVWNLPKAVENHGVEPVAQGLGWKEDQCRGWKDISDRDEHAPVKACREGDWIVILTPNGAFSHAFQADTPNAVMVYDETAVPGWLR